MLVERALKHSCAHIVNCAYAHVVSAVYIWLGVNLVPQKHIIMCGKVQWLARNSNNSVRELRMLLAMAMIDL